MRMQARRLALPLGTRSKVHPATTQNATPDPIFTLKTRSHMTGMPRQRGRVHKGRPVCIRVWGGAH